MWRIMAAVRKPLILKGDPGSVQSRYENKQTNKQTTEGILSNRCSTVVTYAEQTIGDVSGTTVTQNPLGESFRIYVQTLFIPISSSYKFLLYLVFFFLGATAETVKKGCDSDKVNTYKEGLTQKVSSRGQQLHKNFSIKVFVFVHED